MTHQLCLKLKIYESLLYRQNNMLVKVEGGQFVKDTGNKALLTVNRAVLQENEARKKLSGKLNGQNSEINTLRTQVDGLTKDLSEIKMLLNQLVNSKE